MGTKGKSCEALCRMKTGMLVVALLLVASLTRVPVSNATLVPFGLNSSSPLPFRIGFYAQSCPSAESIVSNALTARFSVDVKAPAQAMRMLFHECFVTGCDGSLLVNSTATNQAEKTATPNLSVAGYDLIDTVKAALEVACPGIVSCADIQALMARDASVALGGPFFQVPTGRLDTRNITTATMASNTLPSHTSTAQQAVTVFRAKGFSVLDVVTLMGAHSVGVAFCQTISYRLYSFPGATGNTTGNSTGVDPKMNPNLVATLKGICPNPSVVPDPTVALDQGPGSINRLDNSFYQQLLQGNGILEVDQNLGLSNITSSFVTAYAGNGSAPPTLQFGVNFGNALLKLSTLDVITGNNTLGSIRQNCAILN